MGVSSARERDYRRYRGQKKPRHPMGHTAGDRTTPLDRWQRELEGLEAGRAVDCRFARSRLGNASPTKNPRVVRGFWFAFTAGQTQSDRLGNDLLERGPFLFETFFFYLLQLG